MKGHFLGQDPISGEASSSQGSSLAVRQFVDLAFGWMPVHTPTTPFRVVAVVAEERYCLKCFAVHAFDVVDGRDVSGAKCQVAFCRCCGAEFGTGG